jgi:STE24 endopeptidase
VNIDKAARYHRLKRRAAIASTIVTAAMLAGLLVTGASARLRDVASLPLDPHHSPSSSPAAIAVYVLLLCAVLQVGALPFGYYSGLALERRYGLSTETTVRWIRDYAKAALLSTAIAGAVAEFLYMTIRWSPAWWWVAAACGLGSALLLLARVAPLALFRLFYRFRPLERPPLQDRLRTLSARAGMPVLGVFEWEVGDRTRRANAALVGIGASRRILLSDTLLASYSDDEIEVILAHELAHHAHRDVLKALAAQTGLLLMAFAASAWIFEKVRSTGVAAGVTAVTDAAGLPLLLLVSGAVSVVLTPLIHALSRLHERRADAFALQLTERPAAFVSAMRRLAAQNLAEPEPSRFAVWFFHSHPPIEERIERARRFTE